MHYLLVFLGSLVWASAWAQKPLSPADAAANFELLMKVGRGYNTNARAYDLRYEGVRGSPLIWEEWKEGHIEVADGAIIGAGAKFNIDLFEGLVVVGLPNGKKIILENFAFERLVISEEDQRRIFVAIPPKELDSKVDANRFLELLVEGVPALYKLHDMQFLEADYKGAYSADKRYDEYRYRSDYYQFKNGRWLRLKKKKKQMIKLLPRYTRLIEKNVSASQLEESDYINLYLEINTDKS